MGFNETVNYILFTNPITSSITGTAKTLTTKTLSVSVLHHFGHHLNNISILHDFYT